MGNCNNTDIEACVPRACVRASPVLYLHLRTKQYEYACPCTPPHTPFTLKVLNYKTDNFMAHTVPPANRECARYVRNSCSCFSLEALMDLLIQSIDGLGNLVNAAKSLATSHLNMNRCMLSEDLAMESSMHEGARSNPHCSPSKGIHMHPWTQ